LNLPSTGHYGILAPFQVYINDGFELALNGALWYIECYLFPSRAAF